MMAAKSKLGRNLKPGDLIELVDHSRGGLAVWCVAEVTNVVETRPGWFTGQRMWKIEYKPLRSWGGRWLRPYWSLCNSRDRYELADRGTVND